jgi:uncharacterized protein (TIGR02271 family)
MTTRTVTAMFSSREAAARAVEQLISQLSLDRATVRTSPETGMADTGYNASNPYQETGFFASLKNLFLPDEDRYAYAEGMRRGNALVSAQVDESQVERAADVLEHAGALDLDQQEASWRQSGWTGYDATAAGGMAATAGATTARAGYNPVSATTATPGTGGGMGTASVGGAMAGRNLGTDETIKVVEERLVVGKREVDRGRVRVRSYVVERPVEAEVRLHEERVEIERRPVDRPLTDADRNAAFQERVIEATAHSEEAVVGKEARVVEEIGVRKEVADRTETVRDTVRKTEVEVDDEATTATGARMAGTMTGTTTGATGTGIGAAVDRTLGTNISGTNPTREP